MSQVFISYRQMDDEQRQRVRAFGERLRDSRIDVVLDQFFLDDNPGGPDDSSPDWDRQPSEPPAVSSTSARASSGEVSTA